jgi:hypothetical protein
LLTACFRQHRLWANKVTELHLHQHRHSLGPVANRAAPRESDAFPMSPTMYVIPFVLSVPYVLTHASDCFQVLATSSCSIPCMRLSLAAAFQPSMAQNLAPGGVLPAGEAETSYQHEQSDEPEMAEISSMEVRATNNHSPPLAKHSLSTKHWFCTV